MPLPTSTMTSQRWLDVVSPPTPAVSSCIKLRDRSATRRGPLLYCELEISATALSHCELTRIALRSPFTRLPVCALSEQTVKSQER